MTNEEFQKIVIEELKGLKQDVSGLKQDVNRIEKKLDAVYDQTANLTEFRTEANAKFDKVLDEMQGVRKDLSSVEIITSSNWNDIAKLKAVK